MPRKMVVEKRKLEFQEACELDISPEGLLIQVMRGRTMVRDVKGRRIKVTDRMIDAAKALMPYRLPKLNAIDARIKHVELTHEDWIRDIDGEVIKPNSER
jgi:hypothetical protein